MAAAGRPGGKGRPRSPGQATSQPTCPCASSLHTRHRERSGALGSVQVTHEALTASFPSGTRTPCRCGCVASGSSHAQQTCSPATEHGSPWDGGDPAPTLTRCATAAGQEHRHVLVSGGSCLRGPSSWPERGTDQGSEARSVLTGTPGTWTLGPLGIQDGHGEKEAPTFRSPQELSTRSLTLGFIFPRTCRRGTRRTRLSTPRPAQGQPSLTPLGAR